MNKTRYFVIKARTALRMTQEDFAFAIGRSERTVKRWEAGETGGTIADAIAIMKLCKERGVDLDATVPDFRFLYKFFVCDRADIVGLFFMFIIKVEMREK